MYLKRLTIETPDRLIRDMEFEAGLNLIIDDTKEVSTKTTGNNVGKTTVLKLIDFCLGADPKIIYTDIENKKNSYDVVKDFLIRERVIITLLLLEDILKEGSKGVEIKRNFLSKKEAIRRINGEDVSEKDFEKELERVLLPKVTVDKPSFRQIISHNIRYKDESINQTLKTLNKFTSDVEYETLYLYILGCAENDGSEKQYLITQLAQEKKYKERLETKQNKTSYEIALALIDEDIAVLNEKKKTFSLNESLDQDLEELNNVKYNINKESSLISKMEIRINLIDEAKKELENSKSDIDLRQLKTLYQEATLNVDRIQRTFENLVEYHNKMIVEKIYFISQDLPSLKKNLEESRSKLSFLIEEEKRLSEKVSKGSTFEEMEKVISELNEKYRLKGEYETIIDQITEAENNINELDKKIDLIDDVLFSDVFEEKLKSQIKKFNRFFSSVSQELYGESYALTYEKSRNIKTGKQIYKFNSFNANMSSGKKQGEILCFDIAYLMFAEKEEIPSLRFLLNDKKELMHDYQLIKVAEYVKNRNMQLVISILKDKLPKKALENAHVVVELSQEDKLFKIEEQQGCV